jgi:Pyruvate/2-oxoacid:ferredoxin oxidoreductase delta subunit
VATFERLNPWYYSDVRRRRLRPQLDIARRTSSFDEVQGGRRGQRTVRGTPLPQLRQRFECDNCYGVCPDNAVVKLGPGSRFQFNYDYCKGCGMCVSPSACGAIENGARARS